MKVLMFLFFFLVALWFAGLLLRASFNNWIRKRTDEYNRAAREAGRDARRKSKREGEVTIEATEADFRKKVSRNVGDYVEFEEVETTETTRKEKSK